MSYNAFPFDLFSESRGNAGGTPNCFSQKGPSWSSGATSTIVNYTGGKPGYVSRIWLAVGSPDTNLESTTINVYVDGESSPSVSCPLAMFFFRNGAGNLGNDPYQLNMYTSRYISATAYASWSVMFPIPFSSSIRITLNNPTASNYTIWSQVDYTTGVLNSWLNARKMFVNCSKNVTFNPYQTMTLLNFSGKPGRLFGVYFCCDGMNQVQPAFAMAEGAIHLNIDGNSSFSSSGTEDYFSSNGYWRNTPGGTVNDFWGVTYKNDWAAYCYRLHVLDPIQWNNSIVVTWDAGYPGAVPFSQNGQISWTLIYYTL